MISTSAQPTPATWRLVRLGRHSYSSGRCAAPTRPRCSICCKLLARVSVPAVSWRIKDFLMWRRAAGAMQRETEAALAAIDDRSARRRAKSSGWLNCRRSRPVRAAEFDIMVRTDRQGRARLRADERNPGARARAGVKSVVGYVCNENDAMLLIGERARFWSRRPRRASCRSPPRL